MFPNRIVGYSINDRAKVQIAVGSLDAMQSRAASGW